MFLKMIFKPNARIKESPSECARGREEEKYAYSSPRRRQRFVACSLNEEERSSGSSTC